MIYGDRLREWMGISREEFYENDRIAHLPMDFYYPGKAEQGDLPSKRILQKNGIHCY